MENNHLVINDRIKVEECLLHRQCHFFWYSLYLSHIKFANLNANAKQKQMQSKCKAKTKQMQSKCKAKAKQMQSTNECFAATIKRGTPLQSGNAFKNGSLLKSLILTIAL